MTFTLPFTSPEASLARVGGKGMNLAILARAGFAEHVPPGFLITTDAYRAFVEANQIQAPLLALARSVTPDDPAALEAASAEIAALFARGSLPDDVARDRGRNRPKWPGADRWRCAAPSESSRQSTRRRFGIMQQKQRRPWL